jgi:imidazolonepropionase-like amidohydrolase
MGNLNIIHQIMKKFILVLNVIMVSLVCQAQKSNYTLKKYFFNNYIQSFDYTILKKDNVTTIMSKSHGQDRHLELEDHFNFSFANDSSDFSYKVIAGRTLPPPIRIINKGGKISVLENDSLIHSIEDKSIDLAVNMSNPLSYMLLIEKWVQLGKKKYLVVFDGFNKRNIEIKFAKDITLRNQKLKTYLLQSGLGNIYVFCDQKFKIIGMTNGSSDFVDQDWETFLPVLKKEMLANEMAYNKAIEKEATIWGAQTYLLNNAKVLDIKTGRLSGDTAILIENGYIKNIQPVSNGLNKTIKTVDIKGKIVSPGIFDMHAHIYYPNQLINMLAGGVTAAREMGGDLQIKVQIRNAIRDKKNIGADLFLFGLVDGKAKGSFGNIKINTEAEVKKVAAYFDSLQLYGFKIYGEIDSSTLKFIGQQAKKRNFLMAGHLPENVSIEYALSCGMNNFSHYISRNGNNKNVETLAAAKGWLDPTMAWGELGSRSFKSPLSLIDDEAADWSDALQDRISRYGAKWPLEEFKDLQKQIDSLIHLYVNLGVKLLPGTDVAAGVSTLHREIKLFAKNGLGNLKALQTATIDAAVNLKIDKLYGSIESGKIANLVIYDANPIDQLKTIEKPIMVIKSGTPLNVNVLRKHGNFIN